MKKLAYGQLSVADMLDDQIIDSAALSIIINDCFKITRDSAYTIGQRGAFYSLGCTLRDQHKILVSQIFEANTAEILQANMQIKAVNEELKAMLVNIEGVSNTIENVGKLVSELTSLVGIVALL